MMQNHIGQNRTLDPRIFGKELGTCVEYCTSASEETKTQEHQIPRAFLFESCKWYWEFKRFWWNCIVFAFELSSASSCQRQNYIQLYIVFGETIVASSLLRSDRQTHSSEFPFPNQPYKPKLAGNHFDETAGRWMPSLLDTLEVSTTMRHQTF